MVNKSNTKKFRPFSMMDNLAYAAGDFGCNMSFALKNTLIIFWTQFMGMDSIRYAALLLLVQIWDAINDPLIGTIIDIDKRQYKHNKFLAYIFVGSIGLVLAGALCFIPLPNVSNIAKDIIFVAAYIIWDAFYTIANVPYGSLLSLISSDDGDRASLSAWRSVGSLFGNLVPMVILPFIIYDSNNNLIGERVFIAALIMGVIGFIAFQFMIKNTEVRVEVDTNIKGETKKFNIITALNNFLHNRPAVGATIAAMGMFVWMNGASAATTVLFQSYFKNVKVSGIVSAFAMIPIVTLTPIARKLVRRYGKKEVSTIGAIICIIASVLLLVLPVSPDNTGLLIFILCELLFAVGIGVYSTFCWSMMGDAIDYNEWKNGTREEGTVYAMHSFFRKLAQGIGPSVVLVIMAKLGYLEENLGNQTFEVALNMRYLVAWIFLISSVCIFIGLAIVYNLDKNTTKKMKEDLDKHKPSIC